MTQAKKCTACEYYKITGDNSMFNFGCKECQKRMVECGNE